MISKRFMSALTLGSLVAFAWTTQASAATKSVYAGPNAKVSDQLAINRFYPSTVSIHAGDSVAFEYRGFHNATIPKKGGGNPGSAIAPTGTPVGPLTDPAGAPFWFDGQLPQLALAGPGALPVGGNVKVYNGTKLVSTGLPFTAGTPKPVKIKFTKTGTFPYYCTLHPGMKGTVRVVKASTDLKVATAAEKTRVAAVLKSDLATAKQLDTSPQVPANTISGGSDKPPVNWLKFYPSTLSVPAGTTVTYQVPGGQEPHTLSFANDALVKEITNPTPPNLLDGRATYPSDPPPLPPFDGTNHGGFYSTGILGAGPGIPKKVSFVVTTPGTYQFHCLIHPAEMKGTLTVT